MRDFPFISLCFIHGILSMIITSPFHKDILQRSGMQIMQLGDVQRTKFQSERSWLQVLLSVCGLL